MSDAQSQTDVLAAETAARKAKFLEAYAGTGNISAAAKLAEIDRRTYYRWLDADAQFAADASNAFEESIDRMEVEARRRAVQGTVENVYWRGQVVGTLKRFSDTLMIFLLKAARPDKYQDRHQLSGKVQVQHSTTDDLSYLSNDELAQIEHLRLAVEERKALTAGPSDDEAAAV